MIGGVDTLDNAAGDARGKDTVTGGVVTLGDDAGNDVVSGSTTGSEKLCCTLPSAGGDDARDARGSDTVRGGVRDSGSLISEVVLYSMGRLC